MLFAPTPFSETDLAPTNAPRPRRTNSPRAVTSLTFVALALAVLPIATTGCGGGGGGGGGGVVSGTSPVLDYSKFRDYSVFTTNGDPRPILSEDGGGFDSDEVDGPSVVYDNTRIDGDFFMMYYEAADGAGVISIGLITSDKEDFQNLLPGSINRSQVVSPSQDGGLNAFNLSATDPCVIVDKRSGEQPSRRYKMWFEGRNTGGNSSIVYCDSEDGETWTNFTVCANLGAGVDVTFGTRVADPTVLLDQGGSTPADRYRMWFEAVNESGDGSSRIGYADSSDGVTWTVRDAAGNTGSSAGPVISPGFGGTLSAYTVQQPTVVLMENGNTNLIYHMWYTGGDVIPSMGTEDQIFYATSADGLTWLAEGTASPFGLPVLQPTSDSILDPTSSTFEWDSGDTRQPAAWIDDNGTATATADDSYHLWYAADVENGGASAPNRIGYAKDIP